MTLEYKEDEILLTEKYAHNQPLIGYINPYGKIIDLSMLEGPVGHDNWRNPVTPMFLNFISFVILNTKSEDLKQLKSASEELYQDNKYPGFEYIVKRGVELGSEINFQSYDDFIDKLERKFLREKEKVKDFINSSIVKDGYENLYDINEYQKLTYDLMHFFKKAYSNNDFFDSIRIVLKVLNKDDVLKIYKSRNSFIEGFEDEFYNEYLMIQLMSYLKDICVQYLDYHSIERAIPNKDLILFNNVNDPSYGYTFTRNPKSILTAEPNINEVFYNWILMDWEIKRLPRYYWYDKEKRYGLESPILTYHQTDKEEILSKEIQAIKRQVPKKERYKYFR